VSGFGIREQYEAGQQLADERLWRDSSFLQQLSRNGSLLLAPNHDALWLEALAAGIGSEGRGWSWHAQLLRVLPASVVRRLLWRASLQWWAAMAELRGELARVAAERGLSECPELEAFDRRLQLAGEQIDSLSWCASDRDRELIEVIEG
jgi:hypothetical protein